MRSVFRAEPHLSRRALGALGAGTMLLCSCPQNSAAPVIDAADAQADHAGADASDADAGEPWDPVWHETTPKEWPTVGPEGQPDCGPGCRIALNGPVDHNTYYAHSATAYAVADSNGGQLMVAKLGSPATSIVAQLASSSESALIEQYLHRDFLIYLRTQPPSSGKPVHVEIMNVLTGETKTVFSYVYEGAGDLGVSITALNDKYAFWMREGHGLMSRNLATGEVRMLAAKDLSCVPICAAPEGIICGDYARGRVLWIDQESGAVSALDNGGALQADSGCSVDRSQVVWVDYRDPPGTQSDWDWNRSGGEIYMRDRTTQQTRRLTFDSPGAPKGKIYASIGDGLVLWHEAAPGVDPNPSLAQDLYANPSSLIVLDLNTQKKCRIEGPLVRHLKRNSIHGRHVYGYWVPPGGGTMLVDIDLDNPAIECKAYE